MQPSDLVVRWQIKIVVDPETECWIWTGARSGDGYGQARVAGKRPSAHRLIYELLVGKIPEGLVLDHLCRVILCVNPAHLEPVTSDENRRRQARDHVLKSHCLRGHPYTETNTYWSRGGRWCRECLRMRKRGEICRP